MISHKTWIIVRREFLYNLTRPSYFLTAFVIPLVIALATYIAVEVIFASENNLESFAKVGYVDASGLLAQPTSSDYERYVPFSETERALAALEFGSIQAYLVIPEDYLTTGRVQFISPERLPQALREELNGFLIAALASNTDSSLPMERLIDPIDAEVRLLGEDEAFSTTALILRFALPIGVGFLLTFNVVTSAQFLMSGVVEEKENFILEVLATSARPIELMTGKVLGLGGLALLQMAFWLVLGLVIGLLTGRLEALSNARFEASTVAVSVLFFVLFFLMYASLMIGIGAAVNADQEARQIAGLFILIAILPPSWGLALILESPESLPVRVMSLFPFTAPLTMMVLLGIGKAALWQVISSLAILSATVLAMLWLSARVFRAGMLNTGQRFGWKFLRNVIRG
jgi:ABC-2 type transport system permease protein